MDIMCTRFSAWLCSLTLAGGNAAAQELPYAPWRDSEPLFGPTPVPSPGPAPKPAPAEHARRTFEAGVTTTLRPLACLAGSSECRARSLALAARYRVIPHMAWALKVEPTWFPGARGTYAGIGARVYPRRSGVTDPFVQLSMGGDFRGRPDDVVFASELAFGVSAALTDRVKLGTQVTLHQRGTSCEVCQHWSPWAERWITLGVGVELWLGDKH